MVDKEQWFDTVSDMRALPAEKIDEFCEDLRLWLHMQKMLEDILRTVSADRLQMTTPSDRFGWIDDGRHDANITINVVDKLEPPT